MQITYEISKIVLVAIALIIFGLLEVLAASRLRSKDIVASHLTLYMGLGVFLNLALLMGLLHVVILASINYNQVTEFVLLVLAMTFGALTLSFLRTDTRSLISYWVGVLVIVGFWAALAFNLAGATEGLANLFQNSFINDNPTRLTLIPSILGWLGAVVTALAALTVDFRKRQTTQYLNRLRYWLIATALLAVSGLASFVNPAELWASLVLLIISSVLAAYIVLSYHTPDLKLLIGRAVHYVGVTATLSALISFGMITSILISRSLPNPASVLFWSIILAVALASMFPPVWRLANRLFARAIFGKYRHDQKQVIQHYSQRISAALDINRLGEIVTNLMVETLGIERGIVFVTERDTNGDILFRPLASVGQMEATMGHFMPDSPFIDHFRKGKKTLSQYELDVLPTFQPLLESERKWLAGLETELYVPILRQNELVGLLGFGRPSQGTTYYEEDQYLMVALADQTALAMDSARLFQHLALINQEVGQLTNQLAGLDQNKSDFLSIASHELRTPLTHIHGYSRMLLDLTEDELKDPAYVKQLIEGIAKGSDRMKDVIDMMFDVTEANVGEMNLFLGPVVLDDVIEQAVRPFLPALDQRRIAFGKDGIKELPIIEADGTRLVQAFENLIGNAIKYTPDGGMVKIEGHTIVADEIGGAVEIVVTDTGIGIDPEFHSRVFEKFFRIDDTEHHSTGKTKFKGAGPGLGLTLVKAIAEAHHGRVWVESPGHDEVNCPGSKFYFVIPLQPVAEETAEAQKSQRQSQIETRHWRRKDLKPSNA